MLNSLNAMRSLNPDVRRLILMWTCMNIAFFGIIGVLLNLYLLRLGFGVEFIGLFTAIGQFVWAATSLPAGMLVRRIGLRTGLLLGAAFAGIGMSVIPTVVWLPRPWWEPWLLSGWCLAWVGAALVMVASTPYMILAAGATGRTHAFSVNAAMAAFSAFAGSAVAGVLPGWLAALGGGTLDDAWPYGVSMWLPPILYAMAILVFWRASPLELSSSDGQDSAGRVPMRLFALLGLVAFLPAVGSGALRAFFNVYLDVDLGVHPSQIGAIMGVSQLIPIPMVLVTPLLLERLGAPRSMALVGASMSAALVVVGLSSHWVLAGLGFGSVYAAMAIHGPATSIFSQEVVSPRWRTLSTAAISIGMALGWSVAAASGGILIGELGFRSFFRLCAGLVFVSTPMLLMYLRTQRPQAQATAAD